MENFQKAFKALFSDEDTADMVLVDPENLADTGIDILAPEMAVIVILVGTRLHEP